MKIHVVMWSCNIKEVIPNPKKMVGAHYLLHFLLIPPPSADKI
jgi:hypothetical protein